MHTVVVKSGATKTRGLLPDGFERAARAFGFSVAIKDSASLADIRAALARGIPPIVNWFSEEGHYSVAVALTRTHIVLRDPEVKRLRRFPVAVFARLWFGVDPEPPRTVHDFHIRRLILLTPPSHPYPSSISGSRRTKVPRPR